MRPIQHVALRVFLQDRACWPKGFHASPPFLGGYPISLAPKSAAAIRLLCTGRLRTGKGMHCRFETLGVTQMCDYSLEMYASRPARESESMSHPFHREACLADPAMHDRSSAFQYDTHLSSKHSSDLQTRLASGRGTRHFARLEHGGLSRWSQNSATVRKSPLQPAVAPGVGCDSC